MCYEEFALFADLILGLCIAKKLGINVEPSAVTEVEPSTHHAPFPQRNSGDTYHVCSGTKSLTTVPVDRKTQAVSIHVNRPFPILYRGCCDDSFPPSADRTHVVISHYNVMEDLGDVFLRGFVGVFPHSCFFFFFSLVGGGRLVSSGVFRLVCTWMRGVYM